MDYNQIIKHFLSTSVITAGLVYLAKLIIDKFVESRIDKYKNSLQKDTESFRHNLNFEAEKFRYDLNTLSVEHQIKYSKLYEERGQIIKQIYNLLLDLENSLSNQTTLFQGPEWINDTERDKKATESIQILRSQFEQNRIFFSIDLCKKIESIIADSHKITIDMFMAKKYEQRNGNYNRQGIDVSEKELLRPIDTWQELDKKVQNDIKSARLNLAQEFRVLIGVS
jgi:Zn-dependent oligopeptidase